MRWASVYGRKCVRLPLDTGGDRDVNEKREEGRDLRAGEPIRWEDVRG
jgi:hypothetical protein